MRIAAAIILFIAAIAWLAPVVRACINRKFKLALLALATGPVAVGLYALDRDPNVAMGAFIALVGASAILWRKTAK